MSPIIRWRALHRKTPRVKSISGLHMHTSPSACGTLSQTSDTQNHPGLWFSLCKVKLRQVLILFLNGYLTRIVFQDIPTQSALAACPPVLLCFRPPVCFCDWTLRILKDMFRLTNSACAQRRFQNQSKEKCRSYSIIYTNNTYLLAERIMKVLVFSPFKENTI